MMRLPLLIIMLVLQVGAALALECDFGTRGAVEAKLISYQEFLLEERGAVAIAEGSCSELTNVCDRYLVISHCDGVAYAHRGRDANNPLSIAINSVLDGCAGATECADTFLSAAMLFEADARYLPTTDLYRNTSARWSDTWGVDTRGGYLKTLHGAPMIRAFLERSTQPNNLWRSLVDLGVTWHSSFRRNGDEAQVMTWNSRAQILQQDDLFACEPECSMKLFLVKLEETAGEPAVALRFSGNMLKYDRMKLRTWAQADGVPYNRNMTFRFVSP